MADFKGTESGKVSAYRVHYNEVNEKIESTALDAAGLFSVTRQHYVVITNV